MRFFPELHKLVEPHAVVEIQREACSGQYTFKMPRTVPNGMALVETESGYESVGEVLGIDRAFI